MEFGANRISVTFCAALAICSTSSLAGGLALIEVEVSDNGDDDGFADTNETVELRLLFQNTSGAAMSGVQVELATDNPDRVCLTAATVDLGDLAIGEIKLSPPFVFHVLVDRTLLGLGAYDYLPARFRILALDAATVLLHLPTPAIELDLDLDVSGGSGPTTFVESFEGSGSGSMGAFEIENLDAGKHDLVASDGYRCPYNDPDWANSNTYGTGFAATCYPGGSVAAADDVHWGLSGPSYSPLDGRAFVGTHSLYFGVDLGPPKNWTTPTGVLEAVRTAQPIPLGYSGASPVLSIKQQVSLLDKRCLTNVPVDRSVDRGVVLAQLADDQGGAVGPWVKIYAFLNGYDQQPWDFFLNCAFDPVDDGNSEDSFFDPTDPQRLYGPSSTCAPERAFTDIGETSGLFDPANIGHADGPGLDGFWGDGTWIESKFDLGRFRGRSVRLRFLASSLKIAEGTELWDGFVTNPDSCDDGWWIDDVRVAGALSAAATVSVDTNENSGLPGPPAGDADGDAVFDVCDNCAGTANSDQRDQDVDGLGDVCDPCRFDHALLFNVDPDGDGICSTDNCPDVFNPDQNAEDSDPFGELCDCDDHDSSVYPDAPEKNDGKDNQCPGDLGFGVVDEISGLIGFYNPTNKNLLSWPAQIGAVSYDVVRGSTQDFSVGCALVTLTPGVLTYNTSGPLPPGQVRFFLVRAKSPNVGSWGQDSANVERNIPCAP